MARRPATMKVTTVRFGADLWALLEQEAARVGVSVSQYLREAALARAAAAVAARGDEPFDLLAGATHEVAAGHADVSRRRAAQHALAALARATAAETRADAEALAGQSEQAQRIAERKQAKRKADRQARARGLDRQ